MQVLMNTGGVAGTNCFVVADEQARQAVLFDAPDHTTLPLLEEIKKRNWELIGLWLTHGHFDHLADHAVVKQHSPGAKVLIHRLDEPLLINPGPQSRMFQLPFAIPPGKADAYVEDGQVLKLGSFDVRVLHTPGHSPGHVMYHLPEQQLLVGGDLIIGGSIGRTDLPGASHEVLEESIRKVMKLPSETRLLPGHGDVSTLGDELASNPFVQEAVNRA
jgi:glyoxylase-like metal-dependent hydrolase (beta-lactamase superfamily II)